MKHNFKLKERLGALLLAMLFILQAILGLVPVCVTQAAPLTVETWQFRITKIRKPPVQNIRWSRSRTCSSIH